MLATTITNTKTPNVESILDPRFVEENHQSRPEEHCHQGASLKQCVTPEGVRTGKDTFTHMTSVKGTLVQISGQRGSDSTHLIHGYRTRKQVKGKRLESVPPLTGSNNTRNWKEK